MYQLCDDNVANWRKETTTYFPSAIDLRCPHCRRIVSFEIKRWHSAPHKIWVGPSRCPGCGSSSLFLLVGFEGKAKTLDGHGRLFIDREPGGRTPLPEILNNDEIGEALRRAYSSAVSVFNSGEWNATAVLTRRLLEGVTKSLLNEEDQKLTLAKQIEKLPSVRDLDAPIITIADAIRKGGNLGAHFDLEKEPDQRVSELMLELAEELIEYFYVLPARIS
ncbi:MULTISPECIES: DUF4145 domain-containing protein [unclassified Ectothiorhodospira]|uniref:DUF4145 domain-containing protein n=1 Tax=unclassified Ectothiorhodospira TaxID=2684909 RepID=UPI001EE90B03|nr:MULTISPECIES: DUF4145 domain-containing protein [unclassified Ectothiorhodospira]MCG5514765.1 DUF4145 domain-containing protein [Ectothiorhodospira sp. 9100]MCG5518933.1 DUF4145 domain-containing protein [Ectothiorhodospira sp. 9905]